MTRDPEVSVVVPCYDVERYVGETLDSLLAQTYRDLEVVAVDDGSHDATWAVLESYAQRDARVRVLRNDKNEGLIATLNRAIRSARGTFVARIDADSIARHDRIERQVEAFMARPDVGMIGSNVTLVDEHGLRPVKPRPARCFEPSGARFMSLFANPLAHVTIMARTDLMRCHPYGGASYSEHTEDYELFTRLIEGGVRMMNLTEPLVTVRDRPGGVSWTHEAIQVANFIEAARVHLRRMLDIELPHGSLKALVNRIDKTVGARDLTSGLWWLDELERRFIESEPTTESGEIHRVADLQRADIIVQAVLKGSISARATGLALAERLLRMVRSADVRRHLIGKL